MWWLAVAYPVTLVAIWLALRFVGEAWWPTTAALYLPMVGFGLPLPVLVLAILWSGRLRLLWTQVVALAVLLVPLMGLRLPLGGPSGAAAGEPAVRVLTHNVFFGRVNAAELRAEILDARPDIVVMQAIGHETRATVEAILPGFQIHESTQFLLATRFPIRDVFLPAKVQQDVERSARFIAYTLETPLGLIEFFNVHPITPRDGLESLRYDDWDDDRLGMPSTKTIDTLRRNTSLRTLQVEAIAERAGRAIHPVVIAGDTNLPGLSALFGRAFGKYHDGFAERGSGFGYTFPTSHPWMRIDRILCGPELRFTRFEVGPASRSDHHSVWGEMTRR